MSGSTPSASLSIVRSTVLTIVVAVGFIGAVAVIGSTQGAPGDGPGALARAKADGADANPEAEEQEEQAEERREAYEEAEREGKVGQVRAAPGGAVAVAATGWAGEQPVDTISDDWEPAVAADPTSSFVYTL